MNRPLTIMHLAKYYAPANGGIERHVHALATAQLRRGVQVVVVCINHQNNAGRDITFKTLGLTPGKEEERDGVKIRRVGRALNIARFDIVPELFIKGVALSRLPKPDIIHLHSPNPSFLIPLAFHRLTAPLVITHHSDVIKQKILYKPLRYFENNLYRRASLILSDGPQYPQKSPVLQRYREKVRTLPLGLDLAEYLKPLPPEKLRSILPTINNGPYWLCVGRCVYYKGTEIAIRALPKLPGTLVIVGDGPLKVSLQNLASTLGVSERIVWRPQITDEELAAWYRIATAFLFPSLHRSEGFGLVQVEAMASGCPVINTSIVGSDVSWVSQHELTGLTVPVGDVDALSTAALRILNNMALREKFSVNGKHRASTEFTATAMANRSLQLYGEIVPQFSQVEHE